MSGNKRLKVLEANQFRVVEEDAYGVRSGYPVAVSLLNRKRVQVYLTVDVSALPQQAQAIQQAGGQRGLALRCGNRQVFYEWKGRMEDVLGSVDLVAGILQENGIHPPHSCALCGEDAPNGAMLCGTRYDMVHSNCVSDLMQRANPRENQGSFGRGVVGALLGAVVGILPTVLMTVLFQSLSGIFLMLLPICVAYGYFKLGGMRDKKAMLICTIGSLIGFGLCLISWDVYINCNWMGMSVFEGLMYTLNNMSFSGYWDALTENIVYLVVFGLAGICFMIPYVKGRLRTGKRTPAERYATLVETDSGRTRVYTGSAEHRETAEQTAATQTPPQPEPERYTASKSSAFENNSFSKRSKKNDKHWDPWD